MHKIIMLIGLIASPVFAEGLVQPMHTDVRAKVARYVPNQIYALKTHYLVSTDIILGEGDIIMPNTVHLGDAASWDIAVNANHLYLKAKRIGAAGNLSFSTPEHNYHFTLSVSDAPINSSDQTLLLRFIYPATSLKKMRLDNPPLPRDICQRTGKYNLQYSYTGECEQAPIRACDDGVFTYFKFAKRADYPAVFKVLPDRRESVVNYRISGDYMVIERIAKAFTLRNGDQVTMVYNDRMIGDWKNVIK